MELKRHKEIKAKCKTAILFEPTELLTQVTTPTLYFRIHNIYF